MASSGISGTTKQVVVDLKLLSGDTVKTIQSLQTKISNLKTALKNMRDEGLQNSETYIKLNSTLKSLEGSLRANQKVLLKQIQSQQSQGNSINALRGQLSVLRAEYEDLTKAERTSAQGTDMLKHIQQLTEELKEAEEAELDFSRNVGNYKSALEGLPFGKVILGFNNLSKGTGSLSVAFKNGAAQAKAFGAQLLKLLANPFVAAFAAIVAVVMKLVDAFKRNDDAMTAAQSLFASFKPIIDLVTKGFQSLVGVLTKAINGISSFVQKFTSAIPFLKNYAKAEEDVVRAGDDLEESQRQHALSQSKRETEIAKLKDKSVQKDKYTYKERKKFLQQAIDLERKNLEEKRADAKEELRIAEEKAALEMGYSKMTQDVYDKMSDEKKNEINQLRIALQQTETEYYNGTKRLQSQMSTFTEQEKKEREQRAKEWAATLKERTQNELEATRALEDTYISIIRDMYAKEYAEMRVSGERKIQELRTKLNTEKNLTQKARQSINEEIVLLETDLQLRLSELRRKQTEEDNAKTLAETKRYYEELLKNTSITEDAKLSISVQLIDLGTTEIKRNLQKEWVEPVETALKDVENAINNKLNEAEIGKKFGDAFTAYGIDTSNFKSNADALLALQQTLNQKLLQAQTAYNNTAAAIDKAAEQSKLKQKMESGEAQLSIAQRYADLLNEIETQTSLNTFTNNEIEKSRIMEEQAKRRLEIAQNEAERIKAFTEEEAVALYGSVEEWNIKIAEADLQVVESQKAVADAIKNTTTLQQAERKKMVDAALSIADAVGSVMGSFQSLFETMAEDNAEYADFATGMAMMQILISSAISIAQAIEGATTAAAAGGPAAPVLIAAYIAEMVGIVAAGIANAVATLNKAKESKQSTPKFKEGGLVSGREGVDKIDAKLTNKEYVIKRDVVEKYGVDFFDELNYGRGISHLFKTNFASGGLVQTPSATTINNVTNEQFNLEQMREVFVEAVSEIQPVVSVKEISRVQNRVKTKENLSRQ